MSLGSLFVRSISYPLYLFRHGRSGVLGNLRRLRRASYRREDKDALRSRQTAQLEYILKFAFDHCQLYNRRFKEAGVKREDLTGPEILPHLPILTRTDLRELMDQVLSDVYPFNKLLPAKTGGSTMEPLIFFRDSGVLNYRMAIELLLNEECGWRIGEPWVNFWGHLDDIPNEEVIRMLKYTVSNGLSRRMISCNSTFLDDERLLATAELMRRKNPTWVFGYPRAIATFARFIKEQKIKLPRVRGVLVTAEPLTPEDKEAISSCFGEQPLDRYASRELGMVSQECRAHCGLHVMTDNVYLEFLNQTPGQVEADSGFRVVATDLRNTGMPLIRYETDDVARPLADFGESPCDCRFSGMPLMSKVIGRVTDMFIRKDGSRFSGLDVPGMRMAESGWVNQIQYVQTDIDKLTVNIVKGENYSEELLPYLQGQVNDVFCSQVTLNPVFVDKIPKARSGKFMYSINSVPEESVKRVTSQSASPSQPSSQEPS